MLEDNLMSRPRIFVSSTYYDLKHIRSSLDNFIELLGFDSILSEKGDITYTHEAPLDESCYREATNADIFVLIIGGRYGSASSSSGKEMPASFTERYDSVTKKEYESAVSRDIPIYILIEQNVNSEYHTYLKNKDNENIIYAHVDKKNVFWFIEDILSKPRNNPIHTFERFSDIESWLREQWAGLFRNLLQSSSSQKQIATLSAQVEKLSDINETLKRYLEAVIKKVSPEAAETLIDSEHERLQELHELEILRHNKFYMKVLNSFNINVQHFKDALIEAENYQQLIEIIDKKSGKQDLPTEILLQLSSNRDAMGHLNAAREIFGKPLFKVKTVEPGRYHVTHGNHKN